MNTSKTDLLNLEGSVIAALAKLAPDASVPIAGKPVASKDLQAQLQAHVDTMNSVNDAHAKFSQLVGLDKSSREDLAPVLAAIRSYAAGTFGETSPEFSSFGFAPKKVAHRTVESKAEAAEKLRATRVARHTMGKRQRAAIHGVVPTTPTANVAVAPASAASLAPAANAPPSVGPPADAGTNGAASTTPVVNGATH